LLFFCNAPRADRLYTLSLHDVFRSLVERTVVPHSSATLWRHVESPGEVDIEGSPRSQWCRKIHPHRRAVSRVLRRSAGDANRFEDRKSTRLNSSHLGISYAVFCLKT